MPSQAQLRQNRVRDLLDWMIEKDPWGLDWHTALRRMGIRHEVSSRTAARDLRLVTDLGFARRVVWNGLPRMRITARGRRFLAKNPVLVRIDSDD